MGKGDQGGEATGARVILGNVTRTSNFSFL
jgi:hypothetical protein